VPTIGEQAPINGVLCSQPADVWGRLDREPWLPVARWVQIWVHVAISAGWFFRNEENDFQKIF
jgi:roadblock/LC7 domain-containing protein